MEDGSIIELFEERSELALKETESKYGRLILGLSRRITGSESDAEECLNDSLLALWNSIPPAKPDNLCAFVSKIARNCALGKLDYSLAQKRSKNSSVPIEELEALLFDESAQRALERVDLKLLLDGFLRGLKKDERVMFLKRYYFFDSVPEIAEDMGVKESRVNSQLFRTREKLRKYLEEGVKNEQ